MSKKYRDLNMFKGISSDQEQQQQLEKARKVQLLPGRVDREGHYRVHPSSPTYIFQLSVFLFQRWEFQDVAVECEKTLNTDFGQGKSSQHLQTCFFHSTLHICVYIRIYLCSPLLPSPQADEKEIQSLQREVAEAESKLASQEKTR